MFRRRIHSSPTPPSEKARWETVYHSLETMPHLTEENVDTDSPIFFARKGIFDFIDPVDLHSFTTRNHVFTLLQHRSLLYVIYPPPPLVPAAVAWVLEGCADTAI